MPGGSFGGDAGAGIAGQAGGSEPGLSAGLSGGVQAPSSGGGDVQGGAGAFGQGAIAGGEFGAEPGGALGGGGAGSAAAMQGATGGQSGGTSGGYPQGGQAGGAAGQAGGQVGGQAGSLAGAAGGQPAAGTAGSASQAGMAGGGSGSAAMSTSMLDIDMDDRLGAPGIQPNDRLEGQADDPLGGFGYQRRASQGGSSSGGGQAQGEDGGSQPADSLQPISVSRGRGWATESMSRQGTPMIRVIHVVAMPDRWLVMDERSSQRIQEQIELKAGPRRVSDQLAVAVARRIDSWGLPLSGGYWRPHLHVAVAPGAEWSAQQLQRMLEASGLELHVRPINPPSPAAAAGEGGSRR